MLLGGSEELATRAKSGRKESYRMFDISTVKVTDETQKGHEQVAVAAVVSISGGLLRCAGKPAHPQPEAGCESQMPKLMGERGNSMYRQLVLSKLVLEALFKEKLKATIDVHKVEILDGSGGCDLELTGCIPGGEVTEPVTFQMSVVDHEGDLSTLIERMGLPGQLPVPEYCHTELIDKVCAITGVDSSAYYELDTTDAGSVTLVGDSLDDGPLTGTALTNVCLRFKGIDVEGLSEEELWTFLLTLEHHGEFHALCTLYRLYDLAE